MDERKNASVDEVLRYLAHNGVANLSVEQARDLLMEERGLTPEAADAALVANPDWGHLASLG
jgi:hypothetical protein